MNDGQIFELATAFTIGGHTTSHPEDLKRLNAGQLWDEVSENKIFLEGITGSRALIGVYTMPEFQAVVNKGFLG